MAIHRVELREMIGEKPKPENDPIVSSDYTIVEGSYEFKFPMNKPGTFKYYTLSFDEAGNYSEFSKIITVKVSIK